MTQTLAEKLRVTLAAVDAGEKYIKGKHDAYDHVSDFTISTVLSSIEYLEYVSRIPAQITVGKRVINAPLRVMPKERDRYWIVQHDGTTTETVWTCTHVEESWFNVAGCWATEADAKAYAEASLAVRRGEV